GLSIKTKPLVNGNADVSLDLELQFRALQSQSFNGVPVISNREYKGSISLKNGEPAVVAGAVTHSEQRSLNGIPGLGSVPGLNQVMTSNSKENDEDELLIVITPRVVSHEQKENAEVWMQKWGRVFGGGRASPAGRAGRRPPSFLNSGLVSFAGGKLR